MKHTREMKMCRWMMIILIGFFRFGRAGELMIDQLNWICVVFSFALSRFFFCLIGLF